MTQGILHKKLPYIIMLRLRTMGFLFIRKINTSTLLNQFYYKNILYE